MRVVLILLLIPILLSSVEFAVPFQVYDADIADIDNDSDLDIVIASLTPGHPEPPDSLTFLINNGYGEFTKSTIPKHNFAYLKMVDIDCDGLLDICTKNSPDYQVAYYRNLGNFEFAEATIIPLEYTYVFQYPKFHDIESDGDMDIVINYGGSVHSCNMLINNGDGTFIEENIISYEEDDIRKLDVGDINSDGLGDILITTNHNPYLVMNDNFDYFSLEIDQIHWSKPLIIDMNNDQHNDLVLNRDLPSQTKIIYNDGTGNFNDEYIIEMFSINILKDVNDYNNDGYPDFALLMNPDPPNLYITFNHGDGTISTPTIYSFSSVNSLVVRSADLNGNGFNDLLVTSYPYIGDSHGAAILYNDGSGNFLEEQIPFMQISPNSIHVDCNAGNASFEIRSNTEWVIEQDEAWITSVEPMSGIGNAIINIEYEENPHNSARSATLTIAGTDLDNFELVVTQSAASSIQNENQLISNEIVINNYPNPFNSSTIISYKLPINIVNPVIEIFNVKGEHIRELNVSLSQVDGSITWDGADQYLKPVSSGIYLYRIKDCDFVSQTKRMLLLK